MNLTSNTNRAKIQDIERTIQALKRCLSVFLKDRPFLHDEVVALICQQEESVRVLKHSIILRENLIHPSFLVQDHTVHEVQRHSQDAPTSSESFGTRNRGGADTPQERLQDVAVLEAILPTADNHHAKLLLLALKLEIKA